MMDIDPLKNTYMNNEGFLFAAQLVKKCLQVALFAFLLIYVSKKLIATFRKATGNPMDLRATGRLLSLGLTVILLSPKVNGLFQSLFNIIGSILDYQSYQVQPTTVTGDIIDNGFLHHFQQFPFADIIILFAVWLFISTMLTFFFQGTHGSDSPRIFTNKLLAKNTFVAFLFVFAVYLCVATIVSIPEFQALESSVVNNDELTEFAKEVNQQAHNKDDLQLKEITPTDLKRRRSLEAYNNLNYLIAGYNQLVINLMKEQEQRRSKAIDAYKAALLEKTAIRERSKYRAELKAWIQSRWSVFGTVLYYKPRFESIIRGETIQITRIERDSALQTNNKLVDSMYTSLHTATDNWEENMSSLEEKVFGIKNMDENNTVPDKPKIGEQYGIFQSMSGWLLRTESMSLALIVGLFGFGLLGSMGSTFIRHRIRKGRDSNMKDPVPNLPAVLINGISSAIVVFLAVKGTLVVFSGKESGINPYVLFFTCLVAAVFSEDIWKWAQKKLNSQFEHLPNPPIDQDNRNA
jgi:hypothetical protein